MAPPKGYVPWNKGKHTGRIPWNKGNRDLSNFGPDKHCSKCGNTGKFHNNKTNADGLQSVCVNCANEYRRQWKEEHPLEARLKERESSLKKLYKLTIEAWDKLFEAQNSCCKICKSPDSGGKGWNTDHDHLTNQVRGILCQNCNLLLGHSKDDIHILETAIEYLKGIK